ncbi:alpha/beta hydrolase [Actinoplanes sp. TRM 88003]|uniref:Alpha/beta hydrolase n=1 Tax=Paractinoplanes aksuensis TaxID=2939490 RepID=A0ABT1DS77_9ACTN|nr:alpha/beta hydrolase [Actinoplanes aksuensis]MCO8273693.1 alpha/beta hydrolase [Actinoplanes aksuensis]
MKNRRWRTLAAAVVLAASVLTVGASASAATKPGQAKPTVVLVHGAWADSSGWDGVTSRLLDKGYPVIAPANPLRGLAEDSAYLKEFLATVGGPIVLVGHSYGGAVITNAATGNRNVKALVFVAAYSPKEGETIAEAGALNGGDNSLLVSHLVQRPYPGSNGQVDTTIDPAWFPRLFAADVPLRKSRLMATQQRPLSTVAFGGKTGVPAWQSIPSYALVALDDLAIPAVAGKAMAARSAPGRTVTIRGSHAAMVAHPDAVTGLIVRAARSVH